MTTSFQRTARVVMEYLERNIVSESDVIEAFDKNNSSMAAIAENLFNKCGDRIRRLLRSRECGLRV